MGRVKNFSDKAAIEKLQELIDSSNICFFTTHLSEKPLSTRPMGTMKVDEDGNIWFFSNKFSKKNKEIEEDNNVQLFYSNNNNSEYLSIYGQAEILNDRRKVEELWNPIVKTWFHDGKTDTEITLIKVSPEDIYYWDTRHGKMVSLLKTFAGAIAGITVDDGVEGQIKL
jgi:general stress protein 26